MKLTINSDTRTKDVKDAFKKAFPGLKIEFVRNDHAVGEGSTPEDIIKEDHLLTDIGGSGVQGVLEFNNKTTVNEVESSFNEQFGVNVQVFRKSGRVFIETVNTDQWTLEMQMDASHG